MTSHTLFQIGHIATALGAVIIAAIYIWALALAKNESSNENIATEENKEEIIAASKANTEKIDANAQKRHEETLAVYADQIQVLRDTFKDAFQNPSSGPDELFDDMRKKYPQGFVIFGGEEDGLKFFHFKGTRELVANWSRTEIKYHRSEPKVLITVYGIGTKPKNVTDGYWSGNTSSIDLEFKKGARKHIGRILVNENEATPYLWAEIISTNPSNPVFVVGLSEEG